VQTGSTQGFTLIVKHFISILRWQIPKIFGRQVRRCPLFFIVCDWLSLRKNYILHKLSLNEPVTVAERLRHVPSWLARKPGSWVRIPHRAWLFVVYMRLFCVYVLLYLRRDLAMSWSLAQGVLPSVKLITKLRNQPHAPKWAQEETEWERERERERESQNKFLIALLLNVIPKFKNLVMIHTL
jgi:hypothetical protein